MPDGNGSVPGSAEKSLGEIVNEISEKATLLVREEIELAKAEVTQKMSRIAKGAALAAVGGVFLVFMLIYFLHWLALFLDDILNVNPSGVWIGYAIVTGALLLLAAARDRGGQAHAPGARGGPHLMTRSPEEIRQSLQATRTELTYSLNDLQGKVRELTNWRRQLAENKRTAVIGAAVAGFLIGGGVAATFSLFRRRS
jgi:hypothetical protein